MAGWTCKDAEEIEWDGTIKAKVLNGTIKGDLTPSYGYTDIINNKSITNVFDGVDDYVEIPHNAAQLGANLSQGFTISAWINPRSVGETSGRILDKNTSDLGANGWRYGCLSLNRVFFIINAGTQSSCANNAVPYKVWTHVILTISSGQLANFYVNGVLSGTADQDLVQTISTITTTNVMRIGNRSTATDRTFDGSIRSVKMWNRVLTASEIARDYAGITPANPIHHFKLGGDYTDYGSVGVTATNSGSTVDNVFSNNVYINGNVTIGQGAAGVDYTLTFDGETNDGLITWMEDEDYFLFGDDIYLSKVVYDDLQFIVGSGKLPAANYPTYETFTTSTRAYAFSVDDYIYCDANELPHWWKEGTAGNAHLHFTLKTEQNTGADRYAKFQVILAYADNSEVWTEQTMTGEYTIPTGTAALTNLYVDMGDVTLTNYLIGAQITCRVKRIAATGGTEYADDVYITQTGIHLQKDTLGSRQETIK